MGKVGKRKTDEIVEEVDNFTQDAIEKGIEEAIKNKAQEALYDAVEGTISKSLGSNVLTSALIETIKQSLPEPPIFRDMTTDEKIWWEEQMAEKKAQEWESIKEIWELDDIDLEQIIDSELNELTDISEQLNKDLEEIAEDEQEIPEPEETETDEYEKDGNDEDEPKKCYSISLRFETFNTCDKNDNFDDDSLNKVDNESDNFEFEIPDFGPAGFWCPIIKIVGSWSDVLWTKDATRQSSMVQRMVGYNENSYIIDWVPSNFGRYRDWLRELVNTRKVYTLNNNYYQTIFYKQEKAIGNSTLKKDENDDYRNETPLPGGLARLRFPPYPWYVGQGSPKCKSSSRKPSSEDLRRIPSSLLQTKNNSKNDMNNECCQTTLSLLRKISNVTGVSELSKYPGEMPTHLTDKKTPTTIINNLADWHLYHFDMLDELIGEFPIDFNIEGDEIGPDNISEALAEIYGMVIETKVDTYENKMAIARALAEIGLARLTISRIFKYLEETIKYLEFEYEEDETEINLTFNPLAYEDKDKDGNIDEDSLEEFLKPSKQKIKIIKAAGNDSLRKSLLLIQEAAQITKALHWHKMPSDPVAAKNYLSNLINLGADVAKDFSQYRGEKSKQWEDFVDNIEENWKTKTGKLTDEKDEKDDNPKIKEIK